VIDPARSFGQVAAEYELGRPTWPAAALDRVQDGLNLSRTATVLDLGAGTGKLTRLLLERFEHVVAVEPLDEMRAFLPAGAETLAGTAEAIPVADASVSAVFCAESFHWFDWPRAIEEIARVLEPAGGLAMMWNRPSGGPHSGNWPDGVNEALDRLTSAHGSRYESLTWRAALAGSPFEPLRFETVPNDSEVERDRLVAWIASWSQVASLPEVERETFLAEVRSQLTEPTYRATFETHVYWTTLAP
jgi:SAM-dependent methyltransferase